VSTKAERRADRGPSLLQALWTDTRAHSLPSWVGTALVTLIGLQTFVRGVDMLQAPQSSSPVNIVVDLIGVELYAILFIVSSLLLLLCVATRRAGVMAAGLVVAAAVYLGYSISVFQGVVVAGYGYRFITFGITGASLVLALSYIHIATSAYTRRIALGELK